PWFQWHPLSAMSASARQVVWAVDRRVTRNPDHGFAMAERIPVDAVGWLWQLYRTAPTLSALHASYHSFSSLLLDSMSVEFEGRTDLVSLVHRQQPPVVSDRAEEDFRAAHQVNTWRALHDAPGLVPLACTSPTIARAPPAGTNVHLAPQRRIATTNGTRPPPGVIAHFQRSPPSRQRRPKGRTAAGDHVVRGADAAARPCLADDAAARADVPPGCPCRQGA
ncbi:MAG: hypothetical protein RLZZ450_1528, partial [Pseudomonadota bacterium]